MQAGRLDRTIGLLRRTLTRNAYGEQVETWTEYATVYAQKLDVTGREFVSARTTVGENTVRFRLRYRDDIALTDRIQFGSNQYDVRQIAEIGRERMTEIVAELRK